MKPIRSHSEAKLFFDDAFAPSPTCPIDIRKAAEKICISYGIRGICDPLYIANIIALETGRGNGKGEFRI